MIPLFDIKPKKSEIKQYLSLYKKNLLKADFIQGQQVKELEKALSNYTGIKYVQTCANGTDALIVSLKALNLKKNSYVITTPFSWISTSNAILNCNLKPFFIDIDKSSFNLNYKILADVLNRFHKKKKISCVLSVDLFGCPNNNKTIHSICKKYKIPFIIDGAQSFGSRIDGDCSFKFSDIATTSFFPTKPLGCFGDGGAIFTDKKKYYYKIKSLCFNGKSKNKNNFISTGINSRLDTIQSSILIDKLNKLDKSIKKKKKLYEMYKKNLKDNFYLQKIEKNYLSANAIFSIVTKSKRHRNKIQKLLKENKIETGIYYIKTLSEHMHIKKKCFIYKQLFNAEFISERVLALPYNESITFANIKKISNLLNKIS